MSNSKTIIQIIGQCRVIVVRAEAPANFGINPLQLGKTKTICAWRESLLNRLILFNIINNI
jgi:hypothetical protein